MAYNIVYVEDKSSDSRENDLANLGFEVKTEPPTVNLKTVLAEIKSEHDAIILDYRLTQGDLGEKNAFYDAPTIAATLRSDRSIKETPIFLMSNEKNIVFFYKDFTNHNLFDYAVSKKYFSDNQEKFRDYLVSFISAYEKIRSDEFDLVKILGLESDEKNLLHSQFEAKLIDKKDFVFEHSRFINDSLIRSIGSLIGVDVLSARLGISKESEDWDKVLESLSGCAYTGVFSDIHQRWWMKKIDHWWDDVIQAEDSLRRLGAQERVEIIKEKLSLENLQVTAKTPLSKSTNFWTICKYSKEPLDPFDGIELANIDLLPWQEKEYFSFDSAVESKHEDDKKYVSDIDKKAIRDLIKTLNNG